MASASFDMDRLIASLTDAIGTGNAQLAKDIVTQVSRCHLKLDINVLSKDLTRDVRKEKEFSVDIRVEDRETTGTRFQMQVRSTDSVADLKRKVWLMHNIPTEAQRWIIGKKIPDDAVTLGNCGVNAAGHTLFLYIVTVLNENYRDGNSDHSLSPNIMTNAMSYTEHGERPDALLMNANVMRNPVQIKEAWLPGRRDPPPLPERIPLQDDCGDLDEQTKVVRDPLMQVIPPPMTKIHRESKEEKEDVGIDVIHVFNGILDPTEKELQVDQPPGWECPVCTFFNLPTRPGCEMCSTNRPEGYIVPDNYQMTDREAAMRAQQDQLERLTRQDHETTLRDNFKQWLMIDDLDLIQSTEPFTCPICFDEFEPGEGITLRDCLHQFCKDCLEGAVVHSEEPILTCPYQDEHYTCDSVLQEREIRALVPEDVYMKYLQRGLDQAESQAPNSFHCKTTDCKGWCIYEDEVNFFKCPICRTENCLTCKVIHEGMNCKEYQADLANKALNDSAAKKTQLLIQEMVNDGSAMNCPQCQIIVQKKDGCDWIKCSVCKTEICWVTKGPRWGPKGSGDTSGGCRCGVNGKRCHPNCGNCH